MNSAHYFRIKRTSNWKLINIFELIKYWDLLKILAIRDIQLRYKQTLLGVLWVILQPLLTVIIFTVVFGKLANLPSDDVDYLLFSFAGLLPWNVLAYSLQRSGQSLVKDYMLVTKVFFPRAIIPISSILSVLLDFLVAFAVFIVVVIISGVGFTLKILLLPIFLLLTLMIALGVGLTVSALSVFYRDFIYVIPFILQIWMYSSPIVYSSSMIPENYRWIYYLNPIVGPIEGFRWMFLEVGDFPYASVKISVLVGSIVLLLGTLLFNRLEKYFADVI